MVIWRAISGRWPSGYHAVVVELDMALFSEAVQKTIAAEGGYFKNTVTGEVVNHGITSAFLAGHGLPSLDADVQALTVNQAINLYHEFFWTPLLGDEILDQALANKVFDVEVNQGGIAVKELQQAVNSLQLGGAVIQDDGVMGKLTIAAVNALPPSNLLTQFRAEVADRYREIAAENPKLAGDLAGWLTRLAS